MNENEHEKLAQLHEQLSQFNQALKDEYEALQARDFDQITNAVNNKNALLKDFESAQSELEPLLRKSIGTEKNPGAAIASEILKLIDDCTHQNHVNGGAIEASQAFTATLLDVIVDRDPKGQLYTAKGRLNKRANGNSFARA